MCNHNWLLRLAAQLSKSHGLATDLREHGCNVIGIQNPHIESSNPCQSHNTLVHCTNHQLCVVGEGGQEWGGGGRREDFDIM